tara:strand:+ start:843 stop:1433 length:591 start_codon:yes stop_codon:yes gene_type:complete
MVSDYPSPDPKFHEQAIALMKQKQDQLNKTFENQEAEVIEAPVETPKPPKKVPNKKVTAKKPAPKQVSKKSEAKKGVAIKKSEIVAPSAERKPYYIEAELLAGGKPVGFIAAHKTPVDRGFYTSPAGLELTWSNPVYMARIEALMDSGANVLGEDGKVIDTIDPNTESWRYVENFSKLFLGAPFTGGITREIDEIE